MIRTFLKTLVVLGLCLVVADVAGVIVCVFFDVMPVRGSSGAVPYAIWFVLGVFVGVIALGGAGSWASPRGGNWMDGEGAAALAGRIALSSSVLLAALGGLFWWISWSGGGDGEYFVPDSMPHTITFFAAVLGWMLIFRAALKRAPKSGSRPSARKPSQRSPNELLANRAGAGRGQNKQQS